MTHLYLGANARRFVFVFAAFAAITTSLLFDSQRSEAQKFTKEITPELVGTITGRVFQDYNSNGTYNTAAGLNSIDTGVAGVTITAYDAAGVAQGFTASAANGTYSLNATGTGPYRLEFTTIPAGYSPSARSTDSVQGGAATNAGSTEQFVSNGNTADVNLALTRAEEYCQDNPTLIVSRFAQGAQNGIYAANAVLYDFPYNSGTTYTDTTVANYDGPTAHTLTTQASAIGTIYSLAYNRSANRIYAASFFKKHSGFGPGADGILNNADDPSAIYLIDPATSAVTSTISVPGVTTNSHDVTDYADDNGNTGWDAAAKTGIGGIDLSDDNSVLYVMNMQDRRLYALNSTTGAQIGATTATAITTGVTMATPNGTNGGSCIANNRRPFAVKYYRGSVYIGVVCTGETGDDDDDLRGYIFQVNPGTMAITAAPVFVFDLDYARGEADPGEDAEWQQWRTTISSSFAYPQALLSDIEFEGGNLIIGLRDRVGDQSLDAGPDGKRTAGDTLRACGIFGSWTLESNGRCGTPVTGSAPQTTGEGPGGGEFYHNDDFCLTPNGGNYHDEVSWGSLLYLPGRQHVVTTLLDPISRPVSNGATFDGGFRYWNNSTGNAERAYRIYNGLGGVGQPDFGKSNGLGSLTAMCTPAPIEIGNRIWNDNDNDGAQDAGETPLAGVTVRLYQGSTLAGTAITDANGEYYFVSSTVADPNTSDNLGRVNGGILRNTAYQVRLDDPANFLSGGPLSGRSLTVPNQSAQAGDDDSSDSDATLAVNPAGSLAAGTFPVVSLTTAGAGANNHTFDIGFRLAPSAAPVTAEGRVLTASGNGIRNVRVLLIEADGTTHTAVTGTFGYYRFDSIRAGQTALIDVSAKRFTFSVPTRVVNLLDNLAGIDFYADQP